MIFCVSFLLFFSFLHQGTKPPRGCRVHYVPQCTELSCCAPEDGDGSRVFNRILFAFEGCKTFKLQLWFHNNLFSTTSIGRLGLVFISTFREFSGTNVFQGFEKNPKNWLSKIRKCTSFIYKYKIQSAKYKIQNTRQKIQEIHNCQVWGGEIRGRL